MLCCSRAGSRMRVSWEDSRCSLGPRVPVAPGYQQPRDCPGENSSWRWLPESQLHHSGLWEHVVDQRPAKPAVHPPASSRLLLFLWRPQPGVCTQPREAWGLEPLALTYVGTRVPSHGGRVRHRKKIATPSPRKCAQVPTGAVVEAEEVGRPGSFPIWNTS